MPLLPLGGLLPCFQSATPNLHIVLCVFCVSLTHYNVLLCVCGCAFVIPCSNSWFSTGEGGWCGKWGENRFPISGCVGWGKHTTSISSWRSSSVKRYVPFRLLDHRHTHTHIHGQIALPSCHLWNQKCWSYWRCARSTVFELIIVIVVTIGAQKISFNFNVCDQISPPLKLV